MIGPIGYDIAVFLNNFHWWQENRSDIQKRLDFAVRAFSDAFDLSPADLRRWSFAQMVLSAWWTFDEMPEIYQNDVAKADVWNT
jgi:streptomycin 6-kinase